MRKAGKTFLTSVGRERKGGSAEESAQEKRSAPGMAWTGSGSLPARGPRPARWGTAVGREAAAAKWAGRQPPSVMSDRAEAAPRFVSGIVIECGRSSEQKIDMAFTRPARGCCRRPTTAIVLAKVPSVISAAARAKRLLRYICIPNLPGGLPGQRGLARAARAILKALWNLLDPNLSRIPHSLRLDRNRRSTAETVLVRPTAATDAAKARAEEQDNAERHDRRDEPGRATS